VVATFEDARRTPRASREKAILVGQPTSTAEGAGPRLGPTPSQPEPRWLLLLLTGRHGFRPQREQERRRAALLG
jgi:hypothetical protein